MSVYTRPRRLELKTSVVLMAPALSYAIFVLLQNTQIVLYYFIFSYVCIFILLIYVLYLFFLSFYGYFVLLKVIECIIYLSNALLIQT